MTRFPMRQGRIFAVLVYLAAVQASAVEPGLAAGQVPGARLVAQTTAVSEQVVQRLRAATAPAAALDGLPGSLFLVEGTGASQEEAEALFASAMAALYIADTREVLILTPSPVSELQRTVLQKWLPQQATTMSVSNGSTARAPLAEVPGASLEMFVERATSIVDAAQLGASSRFLVKVPASEETPRGEAPKHLTVHTLASSYYAYQSFEGDVWSYWSRWDNTGGQYSWGVTSCDAHGGYYSADAVRGGASGGLLSCSAPYPSSVHTRMYSSVCLGAQPDWLGWLDLYFTGAITQSGSNSFGVYVLGGSTLYGYGFWGNWSGWSHLIFNLRQWYYLGDLAQNSCNTLYLDFESDSATPGGLGARVDDLTVWAAPSAYTAGECGILADPLVGSAPLTVAFQAAGDVATSYSWDFDDGTTSSQQNPVHVFASAGTYDVRLRVYGSARLCQANLKVTVSAPVCTYSISPASQSFSSAGGTGTVNVTAGSGCSWTASSSAGWITVTSGASGSGNGTVGYSVSANSGSARAGTLTIAGQTFTVSQAALSCTYSISPTSASAAATGGNGSFGVTASVGCGWTSASDSSWLHITGGTSGSGSGTVSYSADANGGSARSGHITVQGQIFTVNQTSGSVPLNFSHWIAAASHVDGAGSSHWRSDVAVLNRSSSQATVEYRLYTPGGVRTQQVALAGNAQDFHHDIAAWLGYSTGSGSLEVRSDEDVFVMGRTYNQVDSTHSYGQNYDGQEPDSSLLSAGQSAWLPLLAQNSGFRCNIAITNTGTITANVTLALYDGQGNLLWIGNTESSALASGGFIQYLTPFQTYAGRNDLEHAYAKVTVNSGTGIVVWASVVDNATGDPTTIFMKR